MGRQSDWDALHTPWWLPGSGDSGAGAEEDHEDPAEIADHPDDLWDAFLLDEDRAEPEPEYGDFWMEPEEE